MLRTGPRFRLEKRKECVLIWNERDFALPRRMVASFPFHPNDRNEAEILAEICVGQLNHELPGNVAPDPESVASLAVPASTVPESKVVPAPAPVQAAPTPRPAPAAPVAPRPKMERKPLPEGWEKLQGRAKVEALSNSLFAGDSGVSQEVL